MVIRYYYWFSGTPEDRLYGPWWFNDFTKSKDFYNFKNGIRGNLTKEYVFHDCKTISPSIFNIDPKKELIYYLLKGDMNGVQTYDYKTCSPII